MINPTERQIEGLAAFEDAHARLVKRGLATIDGGAAGVNADGFQVLGDLATVIAVQGASGPQVERVLALCCRAALSASAAWLADVNGYPEAMSSELERTRQSLRAALAATARRSEDLT